MVDLKLADGMIAMLHKAGERGKRIRDRVNLKMEDGAAKQSPQRTTDRVDGLRIIQNL